MVDAYPESCDIFFNVKLSDCQYPSGCSISTMNGPITDGRSVSSSAYRFSFMLSTASHLKRAKVNLLMYHINFQSLHILSMIGLLNTHDKHVQFQTNRIL